MSTPHPTAGPGQPDDDRIAALERQVALLTARLESAPAPAPAAPPASPQASSAAPLDRRDLLLRGGAVLATAAGAAALSARPAAAAPGDPVLQGRANDAGTASTSVRGGSGTLPALVVDNPSTRDVEGGFYAGPALRLPGTTRTDRSAPHLGLDVRDSAPGDLASGGDYLWYAHVRDQGQTVTGAVYTSAFANHLEFVTPRRVLDTRRATAGEEAGAPNDGRSRVVAGRFDAAGRLQAGSALVLDLSGLLTVDAAGVLGNLTVVGPTGSGFLAAYPTPVGSLDTSGAGRPAVSSLNYVRGTPALANFAVVALPSSGSRLSVYSTSPAHVLFDVVAFSVYDPFSTTDEATARTVAGWRGRP